jgi:putative endonuclease
MKRTGYRTGLYAEALCRWWLRLKGYRILASRYQSPLGEIDIVALKKQNIVMVEVKARPSTREALESILPRQRQRLERGALDFLAKHPHLNTHNLRFDIMLVAPRAWPVHIQNAWQPAS